MKKESMAQCYLRWFSKRKCLYTKHISICHLENIKVCVVFAVIWQLLTTRLYAFVIINLFVNLISIENYCKGCTWCWIFLDRSITMRSQDVRPSMYFSFYFQNISFSWKCVILMGMKYPIRSLLALFVVWIYSTSHFLIYVFQLTTLFIYMA